jgi:hypothetical protein
MGYPYARNGAFGACRYDKHRKDSMNLCATVGTKSAKKVTKKRRELFVGKDKEYFQKNCSLLGTRSVSSARFTGG